MIMTAITPSTAASIAQETSQQCRLPGEASPFNGEKSGVAAAHLNNDGRADVAVCQRGAATRLFIKRKTNWGRRDVFREKTQAILLQWDELETAVGELG